METWLRIGRYTIENAIINFNGRFFNTILHRCGQEGRGLKKPSVSIGYIAVPEDRLEELKAIG